MANSNVSIKEQLFELVNKPCWFNDGILEIRKNSDAYLVEVGSNFIVLKNQLFENTHKIPITAIQRVVRKDLININKNDAHLLKASKEGNIIDVEKAVRDGANVNALNEKGTSALMFAAWGGHLSIVELLVEKGANINLKTDTNALSGAAGLGYLEIVRYLINHGADVNQIVNNATALEKATSMGKYAVVDLLKKHGAKSFDISTSNKKIKEEVRSRKQIRIDEKRHQSTKHQTIINYSLDGAKIGASILALVLGPVGCVSCLQNYQNEGVFITSFNLFTGILLGAIIGAFVGGVLGALYGQLKN